MLPERCQKWNKAAEHNNYGASVVNVPVPSRTSHRHHLILAGDKRAGETLPAGLSDLPGRRSTALRRTSNLSIRTSELPGVPVCEPTTKKKKKKKMKKTDRPTSRLNNLVISPRLPTLLVTLSHCLVPPRTKGWTAGPK